jgi:CheY-like chemotaxis protein
VSEHLDQTFRPVAETRGLEFFIKADDGIPQLMTTDVNRLQQILKNLLSNAFKFTERGRVSMSVGLASGRLFRMESLNDGKPVVAFSVKDTGIGIAPEKQQLIFEAFQQADGTTSRKYGGTGLGLTISREIARLLGGVIEVESAAGAGSVFTLYLPLHYSGREPQVDMQDLATPTTIPPLPEDADFTGRRVLVIDDDKRNIFAITTVLESRGLQVLHAENGRLGVQTLQDAPNVDLILMDIMMPEMDGIEAIQTIRNMPQFRDLPIISLTAKAMKGDREKCLEAGATDYVTKPVDPDNLLALIYAWINRKVPTALHAN